jgi:hypothetical protein
MLSNNIYDVFKFSPDPDLTGWNPSMKIMETVHNHLWPPSFHHAPPKQHTVLQCVLPMGCTRSTLPPYQGLPGNQMLRDNPYTPMQLLNNAIRLLLGCSLYQWDFKEWDQKLPVNKM